MTRNNGKTYILICKGECIAGFDRERVMAQFAKLFSVTVKDVEKLFSGEMQFEKRNLNYFTAKQYHDSFLKIGVISKYILQDKKEKSPESEGIKKSIDNDVTDQRENNSNRDNRRAKLGIRYGTIFILGIFILDEILQMRNVDIGYRPYTLSTVFFVYGCWYYALSKGYSSYMGGVLGIANMAGLIILFFLPDRTGSGKRKGFIKSATAVGVIVVIAAFWSFSYQGNQQAIKDYSEYSKSIGIDRHIYPSDILDSTPEFVDTEFEKVTRLVDDGFELLNENEFRPGDIMYIGDIFLAQVASFFVWIQYQQYLHYDMTGEIPRHLQSRKIKNYNDAFQRQLSAFVQNNRELESNEAFEKVYYAWKDNCFAWDLASGNCLDTDYVCFGLNTQLWKVKNYFFEVGWRDAVYKEDDKQAYNHKNPKIPEMNKSAISSIEIKDKSIAEIRIASEGMGEISGKTLVMVYYKQPTYADRKPLFKTLFVCIGGDVPNKYLMGEMSVFYHW